VSTFIKDDNEDIPEVDLVFNGDNIPTLSNTTAYINFEVMYAVVTAK